MPGMKELYLEKIYAGWLAKIIGIRLGAPVEGWTYEMIKNVYGELNHYPVDYKEFAADDDSNGPLFFLRALEDGKEGYNLTAQAVGEALLNYAPFEHGFFWWGGYGVSTEHTAYLNLRNGIPAPRSGSIEQNGRTVAEQIGGQIFIDTWGLVTPGNPDLAAEYAGKAASVTHDGEGIWGGIFVATCISHAFEETDIRRIIEKGLSYIPEDCGYSKVTQAVMDFYDNNPDNWRDCFQFIYDNYGYDKYPGNCHILPNAAVMILAMLYGKGDFSNTLNICNMCGWDTDCNVGNVATIMGVACGLDGINYEKWREPINDFLACSGVVGSLNIMDIPYGASYITKLAWDIAGEELHGEWKSIIAERIDSCHFEYPGSTHAMRIRVENSDAALQVKLRNTDESAHTGTRSLAVHAEPLQPGKRIYIYKKTYYTPADFDDSRYDPAFSPLLYPGQTVHGSVMMPEHGKNCIVRLYAHNSSTGEVLTGEAVTLKKGEWSELSFTIPYLENGLIDEAGFAFDMMGVQNEPTPLDCYIDDLYFEGSPEYTINFSKSYEEVWTPLHREISQFTKLKGLLYLEDNSLNLSCSDFAEAYTGHHAWSDYVATFSFTPVTGEEHYLNVRVQGAIRSYAAGLLPGGKLGLLKNENGYRVLKEVDFPWEQGEEYTVSVEAKGAKLSVIVDNKEFITYEDKTEPYLTGGVGIAVRSGSHCRYSSIQVN